MIYICVKYAAGAAGQAAKAVMEEAHALMRGQWVCNEKRLLGTANLSHLQAVFEHVPREPVRLIQWVDRVAAELGAPLPGSPDEPPHTR